VRRPAGNARHQPGVAGVVELLDDQAELVALLPLRDQQRQGFAVGRGAAAGDVRRHARPGRGAAAKLAVCSGAPQQRALARAEGGPEVEVDRRVEDRGAPAEGQRELQRGVAAQGARATQAAVPAGDGLGREASRHGAGQQRVHALEGGVAAAVVVAAAHEQQVLPRQPAGQRVVPVVGGGGREDDGHRLRAGAFDPAMVFAVGVRLRQR